MTFDLNTFALIVNNVFKILEFYVVYVVGTAPCDSMILKSCSYYLLTNTQDLQEYFLRITFGILMKLMKSQSLDMYN